MLGAFRDMDDWMSNDAKPSVFVIFGSKFCVK